MSKMAFLYQNFVNDAFMIILMLIFWYEDFFHPQQSYKTVRIKIKSQFEITIQNYVPALVTNGLQSNKNYQSNLYKIYCYI